MNLPGPAARHAFIDPTSEDAKLLASLMVQMFPHLAQPKALRVVHSVDAPNKKVYLCSPGRTNKDGYPYPVMPSVGGTVTLPAVGATVVVMYSNDGPLIIGGQPS